jgi:hypothetical protein
VKETEPLKPASMDVDMDVDISDVDSVSTASAGLMLQVSIISKSSQLPALRALIPCHDNNSRLLRMMMIPWLRLTHRPLWWKRAQILAWRSE